MTKYRIIEEIKGSRVRHYVEEKHFLFWFKVRGMSGTIYHGSLDDALSVVRGYIHCDIQDKKKVIRTVISNHGG